jgi:hypothetical protein
MAAIDYMRRTGNETDVLHDLAANRNGQYFCIARGLVISASLSLMSI